jgi:hypothetical protein
VVGDANSIVARNPNDTDGSPWMSRIGTNGIHTIVELFFMIQLMFNACKVSKKRKISKLQIIK